MQPAAGRRAVRLSRHSRRIVDGVQRPPVLDLRRLSDQEPITSFPVDEDVADVAVVGEFVVFANHRDARVNVVDVERRRIVSSISVAGHPTGLTWDDGRFWYCDYGAGRLRAVAVDLEKLLAHR